MLGYVYASISQASQINLSHMFYAENTFDYTHIELVDYVRIFPIHPLLYNTIILLMDFNVLIPIIIYIFFKLYSYITNFCALFTVRISTHNMNVITILVEYVTLQYI